MSQPPKLQLNLSSGFKDKLSERYQRIYAERAEAEMLPKTRFEHITTQDVLRALLIQPKNIQEQRMKDFLSKPEIIEETLEKATKQDFRAFLRDLLDEEKQNIPETLRQIRTEDPVEYQKALQSWAKIALPSEKNINVDVEIEQRVHMYDRLSQMYGFSKEIEETSATRGNRISALEAPTYLTEEQKLYAENNQETVHDGSNISVQCENIPMFDDSEYEIFDPDMDESSTYDGGEDDIED